MKTGVRLLVLPLFFFRFRFITDSQFIEQSSESVFQKQFEPQLHTFSIKQIVVTGNELR